MSATSEPLRSETVLEWRLSQVFGGDKPDNEEVNEADLVSAVEFDETGDFLAAGDKGGRVVIFERSDTKTGATNAATQAAAAAAAAAKKPSDGKSGGDSGKDGKEKKRREAVAPKAEYRFYAEFQSHEAEFDYLKSLEIEEKINKIRFLKRENASLLLLTTNDKTVKLWKVFQKKIRPIATVSGTGAVVTSSPSSAGAGTMTTGGVPATLTNTASWAELRVPRWGQTREIMTTATPRRVYSNAHAYHINSISVSSDNETFISADDLRVNLWNLAITSESFNVVDIKPANMDELSEVITCAEFHPINCSQFIYSSSKGAIKLADLRAAALCDKQVKSFEEEEDPANKSFFSEIISSISDVKFSRCGRYILSRDYLSLKLWDINMERKPIKTVHIHDYLRSKLCDLYENDCIFDKFEVAINYDASQIVTGSYSRMFRAYDVHSKAELPLIASRIQPRQRKPSKSSTSKLKKTKAGTPPTPSLEEDPENVDFTRKTLHIALHPKQNVMAVACYNNLFIFS